MNVVSVVVHILGQLGIQLLRIISAICHLQYLQNASSFFTGLFLTMVGQVSKLYQESELSAGLQQVDDRNQSDLNQ